MLQILGLLNLNSKGFPAFKIQLKSYTVKALGAGKFSSIPPAFAHFFASSSYLSLCQLTYKSEDNTYHKIKRLKKIKNFLYFFNEKF